LSQRYDYALHVNRLAGRLCTLKVEEKIKSLSKELELVKGRLPQLNRVINIIDYAMKDERDAEDLKDWLERKHKERDVEAQREEDKAKAEIPDELRRKKP
jgi:hypothetical protein